MEKNQLFKKEEERLKEVISIIKKKIEYNKKIWSTNRRRRKILYSKRKYWGS